MSGLDRDQRLQTEEVTEAREELRLWREKVAQEEDVKARLIVKKLEEDEKKKKNNKLMMDLIRRHEVLQESPELQEQVKEVRRTKLELMEKLKRSRAQLQQKKEEAHRLQHKFKICAELPQKEVEFVKPKLDTDDATGDEPIRGQFSVCQEGALQLRGGQALITFEEETVVSQILQMGRCSVSFEDHTQDLTPKRIRTEPLVQFQIELQVSRSLLDVTEVVTSMVEERVEDRLELAFCRPSRGGAEVRSVTYDPRKGTARVGFVSPGVAESLALRGEHTVDLDFQTVVKVAPVYEHQLQQFQSFCGALRRTLLLEWVQDTGDEEEVQDQLEIHFQKPSNGGGEIEHTLYTASRLQALLSPDH